MKRAGQQAAAFCRAPDPKLSGALLHGPDEGAVALRRRELIDALPPRDPALFIRLDPSVIRRDPAALDDALRARSFFDGRGLVLVEGATDTLAGVLSPLMSGMTPEDAFLVVTSGPLGAKSALRRLFETSNMLISLGIYPTVLAPAEIAARLKTLGAEALPSATAEAELAAIAGRMDTAGFDRFLETLALYSIGHDQAIEADDIRALAPGGFDAELDILVAMVADGRPSAIGPMLRQLVAAGATPVGMVLALQRHFRQLLLAASAGSNPEAGLSRIKPPLWGARRDAARAQLARWPRHKLEMAARLLFNTDARIRSADHAPALALVERCALRLAMMAG